jgi:chemotaxis protein MotB
MFALSFASLIIILLCFFVYLVSRATPDSIRETSVIEALRTHYSGDTGLKKLQSQRVTASHIKEIAQRASFGVVEKDGRYTLTLPGGALFAPSDDQISPEYVPILRRIGRIIAELGLVVHIEGHTDDQQLSPGARFRSNWELSAARAVSVLRIFIDAGVSPRVVSAAGRGEYVPVTNNDSEKGRALNRRVTIVVEAGS